MKRVLQPPEPSTGCKRVKFCDTKLTIFKSCKIYLLNAHFGSKRLKIFENLVLNNGGELVNTLDLKNLPSQIVIEDSILYDNVSSLISKEFIDSVPLVRCKWLSESVKAERLCDLENFCITSLVERKKIDHNSVKKSIAGSSVGSEASHAEPPENQFDSKAGIDASLTSKGKPRFFPAEKFVCAQSSAAPVKSANADVTEELNRLLQVYEARNDTWRINGYRKAIRAIDAHPRPIASYEEALGIRGVGQKIAKKVWEIVTSGGLRKAEELCDSEETKTIQLFLGVWGAGAASARAWYCQGHRSLADLQNAALTRHQRVGLRLYDDLNARIPREEVARIHQCVAECLSLVQPGLTSTVCGSYRRGKESCGDVDVLVTAPDNRGRDVFRGVLGVMRDRGFLTDDLVTQEDNSGQHKYLGVCRMPGEGSKTSHRCRDTKEIGKRTPSLAAPSPGPHRRASVATRRRAALLHRLRALQPLHAAAGNQERHEPVRARPEEGCGEGGRRQGQLWGAAPHAYGGECV